MSPEGATTGGRFGDEGFPVVVAHRGASSTHPENTLASFDAALSLGARLVEMDVRLTVDGVPVILHDPDVSRTTDGHGFVHELSLEQVRSLDAGTPERPERVPTLREALELVGGRGGVALEIKNLPGEPTFQEDGEAVVEAAASELERTGFEGPILFLSFNPRSIAEARRLVPRAATGFLVTDATPSDLALKHAVEMGHDVLLPGSRGLMAAGRTFVARTHDAGVRVGTWTVDDPDDFRRLLEWRVDAVATNDPAMGLRVLSEWRAGTT
ncbi:MAG TPA: glycerophosphodiester phosphodiesterase [Actinomycetota bacterium]